MSSTEQIMQCMEVWGGNQPVDAGVAMAALDAWVYCKPYLGAAGGGDVYYVSACATGRITRLLVADVSGHGAEVSAVGAKLRALMRKYVNYLDQTQMVRSLNAQFTTLSEVGCFATAVVCTFFGPTNHLTLCNAGHPPPLIYRASEMRWEYLDPCAGSGTNIPFGIDEVCSYDQFDIHLETGDLVLVYTDSLTEARTPTGDWLGQAELLRLIQTVDVSNPAVLTAQLLKTLEAGENRMEDDVTLLLFRPNGMQVKETFRQRLATPIRLLKALANSLKPNGEPMAWPDLNLANIGGALFSPFNRAWERRRRKATR